ncbi:hypothetical protein GYB60_02105 [bacterium]|nr:hypothetical protein [bacterium]
MKPMTRMLGHVEADGSGRVRLGRFGKPAGTRYGVSQDEDEVLTLTPVISVPVNAMPGWLVRSMAQADGGQGGPRPASSR